MIYISNDNQLEYGKEYGIVKVPYFRCGEDPKRLVIVYGDNGESYMNEWGYQQLN